MEASGDRALGREQPRCVALMLLYCYCFIVPWHECFVICVNNMRTQLKVRIWLRSWLCLMCGRCVPHAESVLNELQRPRPRHHLPCQPFRGETSDPILPAVWADLQDVSQHVNRILMRVDTASYQLNLPYHPRLPLSQSRAGTGQGPIRVFCKPAPPSQENLRSWQFNRPASAPTCKPKWRPKTPTRLPAFLHTSPAGVHAFLTDVRRRFNLLQFNLWFHTRLEASSEDLLSESV